MPGNEEQTVGTRATPARRWAIAGAAALLLTLAGCVNVDGKIALNGKAEATGQLRMAMDKQVASLAGITDLESFKSQTSSDSAPKLPSGVSTSYEETDESYVVIAKYRNAHLTDADMNAAVVADTVKFRFHNKGNEEDEDGLGDMKLGSIKLEVSFPGKLLTVTGAEQVNKNTIRYSGPVTQAVSITATSTIDGGPPLVWLGSAAALLVLLAGGAVVITRRRASRVSTVPTLPDQAEERGLAPTLPTSASWSDVKFFPEAPSTPRDEAPSRPPMA